MSLPFDSSDPELRLVLRHVRLQALTPTSVLVNLATAVVCSLAINPSLRDISNSYPTPLNGSFSLLSTYALMVFVLLIGYCILLMMTKKRETRETAVHGVGIRLVILQWVMAANIVAFTLQWFLVSLVLVSISLAFLIWIQITLYMYPSHQSRPFDIVFIHAPLKLLLILTFLQTFPQTLFVILGWYRDKNREQDYDAFSWHAVAFIVSFNTAGLVEVALRRDFVWTVAGTLIEIAQLIHKPKASNVRVANLIFVILYPVILIAVILWERFKKSNEGQIRLSDDEVERHEVARARAHANRVSGE
ncbi:uncharacterized protein EI90DRAFT_2981470 [Cantharellus anzutake]|uniref:uncharacterized protein n=1 Tax=Cantharellus anzutake TaxID=1750568 RepID=UPI001905AF2B|nr:uncharacterized protein EI90DRAFT_2981470 [Cantharellus anzutake]KAF8311926.1 hypothetical protein EI90DRAFT_2981470 [Cantharellus anzutake]